MTKGFGEFLTANYYILKLRLNKEIVTYIKQIKNSSINTVVQYRSLGFRTVNGLKDDFFVGDVTGGYNSAQQYFIKDYILNTAGL